MIRDFDKMIIGDVKKDNLYGITMVTLVRDMRKGMARQRIETCMTALMEMGYNRQELLEEVQAFLMDE